MKPKSKCPDWVFERSSGYAGWRCKNCAVWRYDTEEMKCSCEAQLPAAKKQSNHFRVWDIQQKEFVDFHYVYTKDIFRVQVYMPNIFNPTLYIIQDWTGLYDVNNKPIYEGDILKDEGKLAYYDKDHPDHYGYIVTYCGSVFGVRIQYDCTFFPLDEMKDPITIGNMLENPEMLIDKSSI